MREAAPDSQASETRRAPRADNSWQAARAHFFLGCCAPSAASWAQRVNRGNAARLNDAVRADVFGEGGHAEPPAIHDFSSHAPW